jgi:hypothetical protein
MKQKKRTQPRFRSQIRTYSDVADTQWYLSASPEFMRESMRRLERYWENRS